jgi:hypothetical protein
MSAKIKKCKNQKNTKAVGKPTAFSFYIQERFILSCLGIP